MADFGGEFRFAIGGANLVVRGKFQIYPSNVSAEPLVNQDGSTSRTLTPKGYRFKASFEDSPVGTATALDWEAILRGGPYNATMVEDHTGALHTWTSAKLTGDIEVDRTNGEVTGIEGIADDYKKRAA
jgi:hypothetical protein